MVGWSFYFLVLIFSVKQISVKEFANVPMKYSLDPQ